jgi:hypothetical protein
MTQEEKQLLLKDLCTRLPYGVVIQITSDGGMVEASYDMRLDAGLLADLLHSEDDFKLYLRPMSSMTEEERAKIAVLSKFNGLTKSADFAECSSIVVDYCNSRHLDYHRLIEKGLALEAPEGMYKND